ncbi:MAG: CYTH domain-containing protein [Bacteroidia bacterium]|nr:CYTH domain-containing protein [Bacteroidia bacterium]
MPIEIERKFLTKSDEWKKPAEGVFYKQGYLLRTREKSVRIRIIKDKAFLTIKGSKQGITRDEYEYEIPYQDALELLRNYCNNQYIEKTRYKISYKNKTWEVDEFHGKNQGLILAEIELSHTGESFEKPPWIAEEVTHEPRYFNTSLIEKPYCEW